MLKLFNAIHRNPIVMGLIIIMCAFSVSAALEISDILLARISKKYGHNAVTRIEQWQKLMQTAKNLTDQEKL